jgi:uncharacterized protein YggE
MMAQSILIRTAAVALLFFLAVVTPAQAEQQEPYPRILVSGQGSADIAPDMAVLQLTVTREAATARAALDANSAAMAEVLKALRAEGVAERDLQTTNFSIQPKYVYPSQKSQAEDKSPRIVGYTVRNGLSVRVRELGKLGGIMDKSVTLGVNEGGNILFTNDDPAAAIEQARARAVADAMAKAKALATAAGVTLGKVLELSEQSHQPGPVPMVRGEMMMARAADSVPVAAGENSYKVTVNLSYGIEQ